MSLFKLFLSSFVIVQIYNFILPLFHICPLQNCHLSDSSFSHVSLFRAPFCLFLLSKMFIVHRCPLFQMCPFPDYAFLIFPFADVSAQRCLFQMSFFRLYIFQVSTLQMYPRLDITFPNLFLYLFIVCQMFFPDKFVPDALLKDVPSQTCHSPACSSLPFEILATNSYCSFPRFPFSVYFIIVVVSGFY